ncbi:hypothetical protein AB7W40_22850 [Providencia rettgeri]|uniref:Uncharacterized protein n=1 Tax=Providencia rettgeri TaxID=587 RepID=A0A264VXX8_PRORE|nr:hypothetical protein [Providencia rettgeri]OZS76163.1 hypothetical protein CHI95_03030 [Providencia rettgeri]QLR04122.1 hypothetical protein H0913_14560 [Providencia rettgeri]CAB5558597.1 Uncharacterised protein [Providencia rettgeri]CAC9150333.1 Uncharacterised protein [Providencia rettgeri]
MKLNYFDGGAVAKITVTSNLFQYKKHRRVVDAVLLKMNVTASTKRGLVIKTIITGKSSHVLRAYKVAVAEANK